MLSTVCGVQYAVTRLKASLFYSLSYFFVSFAFFPKCMMHSLNKTPHNQIEWKTFLYCWINNGSPEPKTKRITLKCNKTGKKTIWLKIKPTDTSGKKAKRQPTDKLKHDKTIIKRSTHKRTRKSTKFIQKKTYKSNNNSYSINCFKYLLQVMAIVVC